MLTSFVSPARVCVGLALSLVGMTACGGGQVRTAGPTASASTLPAAVLPSAPTVPTTVPTSAVAASPLPTGARTPAALAAQVHLTTPATPDPVVAEAVAAYRDFVVQYTVAQGLPDADYAPLKARYGAQTGPVGLEGLRKLAAADEVILGTFTEAVKSAAGSERAVFITSCADASARDFFNRTTGALVKPISPSTRSLTITMRRPAGTWVVDAYGSAGAGDVTCP